MEIYIKTESVIELKETSKKIKKHFPKCNVYGITTDGIIEEVRNSPLLVKSGIEVKLFKKILGIEMTTPIIIS